MTLVLLSQPCLGSNALRGKAFHEDCKVSVRKAFKFKPQEKSSEEPLFAHKDVARFMLDQFHGVEVGSSQWNHRLLQNSSNLLVKSSFIQNSFLMKQAKKIEETAQLDVSVKETKSSDHQIKAVEHQFKFDFQALQGTAKMKYSGYIDSKVEYQAANNTLLVSFEEPLSSRSKVGLSHQADQQQSRQMFHYSLHW